MIPFPVLKNFLNSEKAVAAGVLAAVATVFVFTNRITIQEWMSYTETLLAIYVGGKTIQGTAAVLASAKLSANDSDADKALDEKFAKDNDDDA